MPKPNPKRNSNSRENSSGRSTSRSTNKGASRSTGNFKKDSSKPFRKRTDEGDGEKKRPFASRSADAPAKRPFKREESSFKRRNDEGGEEKRRPYKKEDRTDGGFSKKPFKKSGDKSFRNRAEEGGDKRKSFSSRSTNRSDSKPYKKFGSEGSSKRYDDKKPSRSFEDKGKRFTAPAPEDQTGESRFKKFDRKDSGKTFNKNSAGKRSSSNFEARPRRGSVANRDENPSSKRDFRSKQKTEYKPSSRNQKNDYSETEAPKQTGQIRLNKFIANSGVCSRREADELITMGLISVNGKTITELGYKVNPGDEVRHESKVLRAEKPVYILLNKPKGFLTTTSDPQERNTVMHILGNNVKERIYPVGRLDRNTTGLLLLTNDGDLADKLMHPSYNVKKIYKVELDRPLTKADFQRIQEGVQLEEGRAMVDDVAIVSEDGKTVGLELHIGWNRVVRRIFEALEYEVIKLDRSVYAGLDKKDLSRGQWRFLRKEEIVRLKHYK